MGEQRAFGTLVNGEIFEFVSFSEDLWEDCKIVLDSYLKNEPISIATEIAESPEARNEEYEFARAVTKDGCSIVARVVSTGQVVGVVFNLIHTLGKQSSYLDVIVQTENTKAVLKYFADFDAMFNIYEYHNTNCLSEIFTLTTLPEYGGLGIATELVKYSIQIARELKYGGEHSNFVPEHVQDAHPGAIYADLTSKYAQRIAEKFGMEVHATAYYKDLEFQGVNFMERIPDPTQDKTEIASLEL